MRTVVIEHSGELADLIPEWRDLAERAFWCPVFAAPEWQLAWWEVLGATGTKQLCVWTLRDDKDRLVGLYPLYRTRKYGLRWLLPLGQPYYADMSVILADQEQTESVHRAFFAWLRDLPDWDATNLGNVPLVSIPGEQADASGQRVWQQWIRESGLLCNIRLTEPCMFMPVVGKADVLALFSKQGRSRYRRKIKQLRQNFPDLIIARVPTSPENLSALADLSVRRSQAYQKGRSFFNNERAELFIQHLAARTQNPQDRSFELVLYTLMLHGELVAYEFGFLWRRSFQLYFRAYAQEYQDASPGILLLSETFNDLMASGQVDELNLLLGGEAYKNTFRPERQEQQTCLICKPTLLGRAALLTRWARRNARRVKLWFRARAEQRAKQRQREKSMQQDN